MEENVTVPETPEVVKHTDAEWYRDVSLEDAEVFIRSNLQSAVRSVIATGFYLKHIRDNELYLEAGYKNINEYAMDRFGLSASATSRYITRNTRFSRGGNSPLIDDRFKDFSKSQLQEMLGMSDEQLEQVTPDMTVREIRNMARPKEIPYIEIPGQTELKDIPGVMPEPSGRREMAATDLFQDEEVLPGIEEPEELPGETHEVAVTELLGEETEPVETEDTSAGEIATSQQETPMSDYGFREKQCNALARRLIQAWKPWFLQDFQHRVMNVVESEKQIKEKIKSSSRTWFFKGDTGKIMHANLFDGYIQFWEDACLGNCEWFYLCAAIQRMWNVIALEDAQKISDDLNAANCTPDVTSNAAEKQQAEPEEQLDDTEFLKKVLHRENELLNKFLAIPDVDINDPVIRKQQLIVGALESILCDLEEQKLKEELEKAEPDQPELPILKNDNQRKAFIDDYATWPIWIETKETGERYYRYELSGAVMVVKVYYHKRFDYKAEGDWEDKFHDDWGSPEYYLIQDGKYFKDCLTNKSSLIDYLKEIQKGEQR